MHGGSAARARPARQRDGLRLLVGIVSDTHRARTLAADTIGAEAGQAAVPGALQVVDTRTAFLRLYGARETLCYEYLCETDDGQRCVIAVNARTGQQERIQTSDVSGGVQMQF